MEQVSGGVIVFDEVGVSFTDALIACVFRAGGSYASGSYASKKGRGARTIGIEVNADFDSYSVGSPSSHSVSYKSDEPPPTP